MELQKEYLIELYDYLNSIGLKDEPILSREEEQGLVDRVKAKDEEAIRRIFSSNQRFLFSILKKFAYAASKAQLSLSDIAGEIIEQTLKQNIAKYDPSFNRRLGSYLFNPDFLNPIIRRMIKINATKGVSFFPEKVSPTYLPIPREGTHESTFSDTTLEERVSYKEISESRRTLPSTADIASSNLDREIILESMESLSEKERYVLTSYYFHEKTFEEIGKALGSSRQNIHRIHNAAKAKLRKILED